MSIGPTSPQARRGFDPGSFTQAKREEQIQRLWKFLQGIETKSIKLSGDSTPGFVLVIGANGNVEAVDTLPGDYTFEQEIVLPNGLLVGTAPTTIAVQATLVQLSHAAGSPQQVKWLDQDNLRSGILVPATISGDRTWTIPDLTGRLAIIGDDPPAVASGALGKVDLAAQTANIAATNLSNTPPAGMYEVEVYLMTTTADAAAGTLAVAVGWTDAVGATSANVIAAHSLAATGRSTGRQILNLASGNITYAVTVTGAYLTSAYAIAVRVVSLG